MIATLAGAVALRRLTRADGRPSPLARRPAVAAFAPGVATLAVTTAPRFGRRLGLRPSAAVAFGAAVTALVAASVGGRSAR